MVTILQFGFWGTLALVFITVFVCLGVLFLSLKLLDYWDKRKVNTTK